MEDFFCVKLITDHYEVRFMSTDIKRDTSDGGGNPILYARCQCFRMYSSGAVDNYPYGGVVNLNPDWTVKSLFVHDYD